LYAEYETLLESFAVTITCSGVTKRRRLSHRTKGTGRGRARDERCPARSRGSKVEKGYKTPCGKSILQCILECLAISLYLKFVKNLRHCSFQRRGRHWFLIWTLLGGEEGKRKLDDFCILPVAFFSVDVYIKVQMVIPTLLPSGIIMAVACSQNVGA